MKIEQIDQNLKVESSIQKSDILWFSPRKAPFRIYGLYEPLTQGPFQRLDPKVAVATSPGVESLNLHTAGGRIRFATDSPYIAIKADMPATETMPHITKLGQSGFDLYRRYHNEDVAYRSYLPPSGPHPGYESVVETDGAFSIYTIHMPLYDGVNELYIGLAAGSVLEAAPDYRIEKPIVYYGSSITQGGCASKPGNAYQAIIAQHNDVNFINLGFSGSGKAEDAMIKYLSSIPASMFVCDYDHNAPDADHLRATHERLYRAYRKANPETPILFVSKPDFHPYEPEAASINALRRSIIHETYLKALTEGDPYVDFLDGENLFQGLSRESCTVDGCHPNDLGFFRMAQLIGERINKWI